MGSTSSHQLSLSRGTKHLYLLSLQESRLTLLSSTLLPSLNPPPPFCCFCKERCQVYLVLMQQGQQMAFELTVSLPPSQGDAPQVTISESLHTYISFTEGMSGAFSLSLFPQQNKMLLRRLHWEIWQVLNPSSEVILEQMTQKPFRLLSPHQSWRKVNFVLNSDQNPIQSLKGKLALRLKT